MSFQNIPPYLFHYLAQFLNFEIVSLSLTCKTFHHLSKQKFHKYITCHPKCSLKKSFRDEHFGCLIKHPQLCNSSNSSLRLLVFQNIYLLRWFTKQLEKKNSTEYMYIAIAHFCYKRNVECLKFALDFCYRCDCKKQNFNMILYDIVGFEVLKCLFEHKFTIISNNIILNAIGKNDSKFIYYLMDKRLLTEEHIKFLNA